MNRATRIHNLGSSTRDSFSITFAKSSRKIFHGLGMLGNDLDTGPETSKK